MSHILIRADARRIPLADGSVHCVVTSPPYWGLRDYGVAGQIGLERTPGEFVAAIVSTFREVRRVLRADGTLWLNLGDKYAYDAKWGGRSGWKHTAEANGAAGYRNRVDSGLKPKDLIGIPWRVAFALQDDGWFLRSDVVWSKPNPMPESVTDRPTKSHEYIFLLTKSERYYFDSDAVRQPQTGNAHSRGKGLTPKTVERTGLDLVKANRTFHASTAKYHVAPDGCRKIRTVWEIPTHQYPGSHFATFPPAIVRPCVLAGSPKGGVVFDPFGGSGTTVVVAQALGRRGVMTDLSPEYLALARRRIERPHAVIRPATGSSAPLPLFD